MNEREYLDFSLKKALGLWTWLYKFDHEALCEQKHTGLLANQLVRLFCVTAQALNCLSSS